MSGLDTGTVRSESYMYDVACYKKYTNRDVVYKPREDTEKETGSEGNHY